MTAAPGSRSVLTLPNQDRQMSRPHLLPALCLSLAGTIAPAASAQMRAAQSPATVARVVTNDNRKPAGTLSHGVLTLRLEARLADWHPEGDSAEGATVPAFAERGGAARIPGPLIRVLAGTTVALDIRNSLAQRLTVRGLHAHGTAPDARTAAPDSIELAPGESRQVRFTLDAPGTYYYYGSTRGQTIDWRAGDDSQLSGAIVVDPPGARTPRDRIFVLGVWSDTAGRVLALRKRILSVMNGRSWPHTERLAYAVGDTVHWRVINASADSHPMHLHGFYYLVDARGDGRADTTFETARRRQANTEDLLPGNTMTVSWVPDRAGNWLFHCHLPEHFSARGPMGMTPTPSSVASMRGHGSMNHALTGMGGLVLGIVVHGGRGGSVSSTANALPARRDLRLLIRRNAGDSESRPFYSFALAKDGVAPPPDTGLRVGPPIVITRGEPVRITVVNTLDVPTAVHWHGIELDSYYDGIAGFSGAGTHIAPIIAAADSFIVRFTPPRAGTFIYHTHVDETRQQLAGLAGPLIVLEPGEAFDSTRDHTFIIGTPLAWEDEIHSVLINGSAAPAASTIRAGVPQRLRFINVTLRRPGARVELWRDTTMLQWRPLAKDGADLPVALQVARPARTSISIGETLDYEMVVSSGGNTRLEVHGRDGKLLATVPLTVVAEP